MKIAGIWGDNVQGAKEAQEAQDARGLAGSPRPANVNETGEILAAWCFIHMTRHDKTTVGCWPITVDCFGWLTF